MSEFQRLLKYESCLRHRSFRSVHKKKHAVYHFKNTFYLSPEISMSRCIYYINLNTFVMCGGVFGKYGYSSFTLQSVGIHNPVLDNLIFSVYAPLLK